MPESENARALDRVLAPGLLAKAYIKAVVRELRPRSGQRVLDVGAG
jgi:precorrin-6B methylase 2